MMKAQPDYAARKFASWTIKWLGMSLSFRLAEVFHIFSLPSDTHTNHLSVSWSSYGCESFFRPNRPLICLKIFSSGLHTYSPFIAFICGRNLNLPLRDMAREVGTQDFNERWSIHILLPNKLAFLISSKIQEFIFPPAIFFPTSSFYAIMKERASGILILTHPQYLPYTLQLRRFRYLLLPQTWVIKNYKTDVLLLLFQTPPPFSITVTVIEIMSESSVGISSLSSVNNRTYSHYAMRTQYIHFNEVFWGPYIWQFYCSSRTP
jgi:hypothetical protein